MTFDRLALAGVCHGTTERLDDPESEAFLQKLFRQRPSTF